MNYILYVIYNLICQILTLWFLLMANTYFNWFFIPNSFLWKNGKQREDWLSAGMMQTIILLVEAALLILLMYYINKRFLSGITKATNGNTIAMWTAVIYSIITIVFIVALLYSAVK